MALVDIGGGTADLAIFERGSLWHTGVVAVGGDHFTNDIAVGLRTPIPDAEKLKRKSGCALSSMVDEDDTIEVASVGGRKPRLMARRILSEILQPRAEEIFHLVWDEIRRAGYEKSLNSGIVLTGGGVDSRRDAGNRRADLRPADPARPSRRRRRAGRSRDQPDVRDAGRAGALRASQPRAGARRAAAAARSAAWPDGCAGSSRSSSETGCAGRDFSRVEEAWHERVDREGDAELRLTLDPEARRGAKIKVIGVGGGGSNAVNRMVEVGLAASSSSSPTPTCRRSTTTRRPSRCRSATS